MDEFGTLDIHKNREMAEAGLPYKEKVRQLLRASVAPETRRAYASRLKRFFTWCQAVGVSTAFPTSPEVLAAYVASLADSKAAPATIEQILAAIAAAHRAEGIPSPTETLLVKKTLKGYRREHGTAPRKKDAATVEVVRMLLAATARDDSPKNIRDAAIISLASPAESEGRLLAHAHKDVLRHVRSLAREHGIRVITVKASSRTHPVKDGPGGAGDAKSDLPRPGRGRLPDVAPEEVAVPHGASRRPVVPADTQEWPGDP